MKAIDVYNQLETQRAADPTGIARVELATEGKATVVAYRNKFKRGIAIGVRVVEGDKRGDYSLYGSEDARRFNLENAVAKALNYVKQFALDL